MEYEDYTLRLLGEKGFSTPEPLDIVEITPEREYLIAMEFFEDAVEISEAEVDDQIIDDGLQLIRKMWDVGLSHRDIKPANLMVQNGRLRLIDVFFVQVRPSPWRQAVDLGNMMLVLALRSDPEHVYEKALAYFTPEELAEAFAATRGVASPTQLRSIDEGGRSRAAREVPRAGAGPQAHRDPAVERPSGVADRRHGAPAVADRVDGVRAVHPLARRGGERGLRHRPDDAADGTGGPDGDPATVHRRPAARMGHRAGVRRPGPGELHGRDRVRPGEPGHRDAGRRPARSDAALQTIPVEGGCVTYEVPPGTEPGSVPSFDAGGGLRLIDRSELVAAVERDEDLTLCGAEAPPCAPAPEG